jgi:hypothetical protein
LQLVARNQPDVHLLRAGAAHPLERSSSDQLIAESERMAAQYLPIRVVFVWRRFRYPDLVQTWTRDRLQPHALARTLLRFRCGGSTSSFWKLSGNFAGTNLSVRTKEYCQHSTLR